MDNIRGVDSDPDLFERFYRDHVEAVERFVARRVDDPHAAADLTADVFLKVIQAAHGYRPEQGPPRAWLFGIARNVVAQEHRRRARQRRALSRYHTQRVLQPDAIERAVERIDAAKQARQLHESFQALPSRLRAVLELTAIDGLSVTDAAAVLQISPGTARVRLHRARRKLADNSTTSIDPELLAREAGS